MNSYEPFSNSDLKRIIAFVFVFFGFVFGYVLGWRYLAEGRNGWVGICFGIYFFSSLFWMFKSMKHLYIAVGIPFAIIVGAFLLSKL